MAGPAAKRPAAAVSMAIGPIAAGSSRAFRTFCKVTTRAKYVAPGTVLVLSQFDSSRRSAEAGAKNQHEGLNNRS